MEIRHRYMKTFCVMFSGLYSEKAGLSRNFKNHFSVCVLHRWHCVAGPHIRAFEVGGSLCFPYYIQNIYVRRTALLWSLTMVRMRAVVLGTLNVYSANHNNPPTLRRKTFHQSLTGSLYIVWKWWLLIMFIVFQLTILIRVTQIHVKLDLRASRTMVAMSVTVQRGTPALTVKHVSMEPTVIWLGCRDTQ